MTPAILYHGIISSVEGANPGPASGITYTVEINVSNTAPLVKSGVKPHNGRLPDVIHTRAATPGTAIQVLDVGGFLQFYIEESFDFDQSCEDQP